MEDNTVFSQMKVAVVDDHDLIREGINSVLLSNGISESDRYCTGLELVSALEAGKCYDIFVVDIELPDMDGFDLICKIRKLYPAARFIVSTVHDEIWTLRKMLAHNVDAIIYKSENSNEIITAIKEISMGNTYYCEGVEKALDLAEDKTQHPSSRELEVLGHIAQGKTTREIADALFVSENTIEAHRKALMSKLHAVNMADLIVKSIAKGYVKKN